MVYEWVHGYDVTSGGGNNMSSRCASGDGSMVEV